MHGPQLLGDVDLIRVIVIIAFVAFWIIGQLIRSAQGGKPAEKPRQQPRRRPQPQKQPGRAQANVPGGGQDALRNEIDSFLQRAAQRRGVQPVQEVEILEPEVIEKAAPRRLVEAIEAQPPPLKSAADDARQVVRPDAVAQHAEQLGSKVDLADEKIEGHLHEVFDHKLGSLADTSGESPHDAQHIAQGTDSQVWESTASKRQRDESSTDLAQDIAAMLRNPSSLKDAIILTEIFRRPEDRI